MQIAVSMLEGQELNVWVAKALGHDVYGKAYCYYDPETGSPTMTHEQKPSQHHHLRYVHLSNCLCNVFEEHEDDLQGFEEILSSFQHDHIFGHEPYCFSPVYDYDSDFHCAMSIVREKRISLIALDNSNEWKAYKGNISFVDESEIVAAMRVLVASVYGDYVNSDELCNPLALTPEEKNAN